MYFGEFIRSKRIARTTLNTDSIFLDFMDFNPF